MWLIESGVALLDDLGDRRQPDLLRRLAGHRRGHVNVIERPEAALELGLDLEHDAILIGLREDGRHETLSERVVQRVVDRRRRDAEPARGRAVEVDVGLQAAVLEIAGDIGELRHLFQPVGELVHPRAQFSPHRPPRP